MWPACFLSPPLSIGRLLGCHVLAAHSWQRLGPAACHQGPPSQVNRRGLRDGVSPTSRLSVLTSPVQLALRQYTVWKLLFQGCPPLPGSWNWWCQEAVVGTPALHWTSLQGAVGPSSGAHLEWVCSATSSPAPLREVWAPWEGCLGLHHAACLGFS